MRYHRPLGPNADWDAIVTGAGAAGLMAAIEAGKRGKRVVVLEHNAEAGRKILISGGGRCNFTNLHTSPHHFLSSNPHFAKSALSRYTPADFVTMVRGHSIPFHEKTDGQLFCDRSARDITTMLRTACQRSGVRVVLNCKLGAVRRTTQFIVETSLGEFAAPVLVVATGGLSIPKIGASDWGYRVARQFGLRIVPCYPALVPLTSSASDRDAFAGMAGVAADACVSNHRAAFREKLLFTHRGLSGPAILQLSSYWTPGEEIRVDFLPGVDSEDEFVAQKRSAPRTLVRTALDKFMPRRLADNLSGEMGHKILGILSDRELRDFCRRLHSWPFHPAGTEGFEKAEVTAGGVHTDEISSRNMEARNIPGLFFVGEVVDVTGHLGGFNFQWAWASGHAAGQSI